MQPNEAPAGRGPSRSDLEATNWLICLTDLVHTARSTAIRLEPLADFHRWVTQSPANLRSARMTYRMWLVLGVFEQEFMEELADHVARGGGIREFLPNTTVSERHS